MPQSSSVAMDVTETGGSRVARLITELSTPALPVVVISLLCGTASAPAWAGLGWGTIPAVLCGVVPYAVLEVASRRGMLTDRHVTQKRQRPWAYGICLVSVAVSVVLLALLGAPPLMFWALGTMLVGLIAAGGITVVGPKVSVHAFCWSALCVFLALLFSPWWLLLGLALPVIAWSRLRLGHHSPVEVVLGTLLGGAVTAVAWFFQPM
ncbi:hypothetical protein [Pseudoclavibacter helvolus]|uniref:hypothetical protein n=1 Tax=Pseudoclavibacter helvolus TaxID=255205 RepID=UPI003C70970C